jgi:Ca2+-binding EF-hand superfamily protein
MGPAPDTDLSPAGANGHAQHGSSFGGAQPTLLQLLHDATHFSLPELGALRERFALHGAPLRAPHRCTQACLLKQGHLTRVPGPAREDSRVDLHIFSAHLGDAFGADGDGDLLRRIFHALDADGGGLLDFAGFVRGLSNVFRGTDAEVLSFAFRMYDSGRCGELAREQLAELLRGMLRQHGEAWGQRKWNTPLEELLDALLESPEAAAEAAAQNGGSPPKLRESFSGAPPCASAAARATLLALRAEVQDLLTRYSAGRHLAVAEGGASSRR